jgi:hypothetical protein
MGRTGEERVLTQGHRMGWSILTSLRSRERK